MPVGMLQVLRGTSGFGRDNTFLLNGLAWPNQVSQISVRSLESKEAKMDFSYDSFFFLSFSSPHEYSAMNPPVPPVCSQTFLTKAASAQSLTLALHLHPSGFLDLNCLPHLHTPAWKKKKVKETHTHIHFFSPCPLSCCLFLATTFLPSQAH